MKKILELTGEDFLKGYSTQAGLAEGGVFQVGINFDPFKLKGYIKPSLSATELTAPVTNPIKFINSWHASATGYIYAQSTTKLYEYLVSSPYTQTDRTASITTTQPIAGAIVWGDPTTELQKYIYAQYSGDVKVYADPIPVESGASVEILTNVITSTQTDIRPMCVGADKYLYIGTADAVSQIVRSDQVSGNTHDKFLIDVGFTVRDLINDGRYLVILADNNEVTTTSRVVGSYRCRVYFWDMNKSTADVIWDIEDSYLIGGKFKDDKVYIFGYNGIYVCNLVTSPKMIWDFRGNSTITKRPTSPYQITMDANSIYWVDGNSTGQDVYAIRGQVVYSPYHTHDTSASQTGIGAIGETLVVGTSTPKLFLHNVGTTPGNATIQTAIVSLPQPYSHVYTRVVLQSALSSGQSVSLTIYNASGDVVSDSGTHSYSTVGAKKSLVFNHAVTSTPTTPFDDLTMFIVLVGGSVDTLAMQRVAVYGMPCDDNLQR